MVAVQWGMDNWDLILTALSAIAALIQTTKWGRSKHAALVYVADSIEHMKDPVAKAAVKDSVKHVQAFLDPATRGAILSAVATVDKKKRTPNAVAEFIKFIIGKHRNDA